MMPNFGSLNSLMGMRGGPGMGQMGPMQGPMQAPAWGNQPPMGGPMHFQPGYPPTPVHPGMWGGQPQMSGPMPFQGGQINLGALGGQSPDMMRFMKMYSQMRQPQMGAY